MRCSDETTSVRQSAEALYGRGQQIWYSDDPWNVHKRREIDAFGRAAMLEIGDRAARVLDVGSGNQPYDWLPETTIHLDRFEAQLSAALNGVAADAESLPFNSNFFDLVVCVGAVLNYVSAAETLAEIARVLAPSGLLLLHFESSASAEHLGAKRWNAPVARLDTINSGRPDSIWIYSPRYVQHLLARHGLTIRKTHRFHMMSALGLRAGLSQNMSVKLLALERFLKVPLLADDVILLAEKS